MIILTILIVSLTIFIIITNCRWQVVPNGCQSKSFVWRDCELTWEILAAKDHFFLSGGHFLNPDLQQWWFFRWPDIWWRSPESVTATRCNGHQNILRIFLAGGIIWWVFWWHFWYSLCQSRRQQDRWLNIPLKYFQSFLTTSKIFLKINPSNRVGK